jgi:hypothetical protein
MTISILVYSLVGDVVYKYAAIGSTIERSTETSEFFLSCGIPYLLGYINTSRLMALPSTKTSFSMKSAPTVAL